MGVILLYYLVKKLQIEMPHQKDFTPIVVHYPRPSASAVLDLRLYAFWLVEVRIRTYGWLLGFLKVEREKFVN